MTWEASEVLKVPGSATFRDRTGWSVFVVSRRKKEAKMLNIIVCTATFAAWMGARFTICVLGGVPVPGLPIRHQTLESLLPGFSWISLGSFVLGLAESLFYGVYAVVVLVAVFNFFHRPWVGTGCPRRDKRPGWENNDSRVNVAGHGRMDMLRRTAQFVSVVLSAVVLAVPISACLTPSADMSMEQRECCEKMAGRCEISVMPSSHSCCQHPVSRHAVAASRVQSSDFSSAITMLAEAPALLPRPMIGTAACTFRSPPESPPESVSVLRI